MTPPFVEERWGRVNFLQYQKPGPQVKKANSGGGHGYVNSESTGHSNSQVVDSVEFCQLAGAGGAARIRAAEDSLASDNERTRSAGA